MKKLMLILTVLATMLFGMSSCLTDVIDNPRDGIPPVSENSFFMRLSVSSGNITTRSTAAIVQPEAGETDVRSLHLFFFNEHENFAGMVTKGDLDLNPSSPCILASGDLLEVDLTQPEAHNLNNSTDYRILAIANLGAYVADVHDWVRRFENSTLETVRDEVVNAAILTSGNTGIQSNTLLMSAEVEKSAIEHFITVPLIRVVARLDVIVNPRLNSENPNNVMITHAKVVNVAHRTGIWSSAYNDRSAHANLPMLNFDATDSLLGRLYAFENEVVAVSQNDTQTTAVIIGISRSGSVTAYHRVNVAVPTRGQILRRNNVYQITINHVLADGQPSWEAAYALPRTTLDVSINDVNMDDQGLIFIDGDNILAIPTGLIVFPPEGIEEQIFNIFTHTPDPANVRLGVSAINLDPGLSAVLSGNELRLSATPATEPRRGYITLAFGNIRATIYIEQASMYQEYLMVSVGMNDIPAFWNVASDPGANPNGGIMADAVQVTSSSQWTARVYNDFFEFVDAAGNIIGDGDAVSGQSGGTFRLQANEANPHGDMRFGFVIVSLMSNPNMNRVLILRQRGTSTMHVTNPAHPEVNIEEPVVRFDSYGNVADGFIDTFQINVFNPGDDGGGTPPAEYWRVERISGADNFAVVPTVGTSAVSGSNLTITALTPNFSGSNRVAVVYLQSVNNPALTRSIRVEQGSHTLTLSDPPTAAVSAMGGISTGVTVNASTNWNATIETISGTYGGRRLVHHEAELVNQGGNLHVRFPKIYFPNRRIPVSATVTVSIGDPTVPGGGITRTFNVVQTALMPINAGIEAVGVGSGWGRLTATGTYFNTIWVNSLRALPGYNFLRNTGNTSSATTPNLAGATYVQLAAADIGGSFNWTTMSAWMDEGRGLLKIIADRGTAPPLTSLNNANSPLQRGGWPAVTAPQGGTSIVFNAAHENRKIYQFVVGNQVVHGAHTPGIQDVFAIGTPVFTGTDALSTSIPLANLQESAIALTRTGDHARFVICPLSRIIWSGEGEQFHLPGGTAVGAIARRALLDNMMYYVGNAIRYGSHFTDLFVEEDHPSGVGQPAPWSSHWDARATGGTDNRGVPTR